MSPSILLFGATSLLGFHLARKFPFSLLPFITPGNTSKAVRQWPKLHLEDAKWLDDLFSHTRPAILLYIHAVCDVAKCETYPEWAYQINVRQVERVLNILPAHTRLVYLSSDHVFGGDGIYHENSGTCPISIYGRTRVEAEQLVLTRPGSLVIRAGLGIGPSPDGRTGHLDWLRYRTTRQLPITIIKDEYRSAVWQHDLATRVMYLSKSKATGIRHVSATKAVSRVELVQFLNEQFGIGADFKVENRHQQSNPHLGRVELDSVFKDDLSRPLASVVTTNWLRPSSRTFTTFSRQKGANI